MPSRLPPFPLRALHVVDYQKRSFAFCGDSMLVAQVSSDLATCLRLAASRSESAVRDILAAELGAAGRDQVFDDLRLLAARDFFRARVSEEDAQSVDASRIAGMLASPPRPQLLQLAVAAVCNLRCRYCYAAYGSFHSKSRTPFMTTTTFASALKLLLASSSPVLRLSLLGGEPLLHPHFVELLRTAHSAASVASKELIIALDTNGTFLP